MFFDELGEPWPVHSHRGLSYERKRAIAIEGVGKEATEQFIAQEMMAITVDATYGRRVQSAYRRIVAQDEPATRPPQILREDPYPGLEAEEIGVVRELIPEVDLYDRFGFPRTALASAVLGELGDLSCAQLTVYTGALGEADNYSYTFLIERHWLAEGGIRKEAVVQCRLRGVAVPERQPVWFCDQIEVAV